MAELLNLAHMPWWAWLACWLGTFFVLHRAERHRVTSANAAAAAISGLFLASILMGIHAVARIWTLQPAMGWTFLALSFLLMLFSSSRSGFGLIFFMLGAGLLLSSFGRSWMPPLASLLLCGSLIALAWTWLGSKPKPPPAPLEPQAEATLQARLSQPDAQDGADKYTRE